MELFVVSEAEGDLAAQIDPHFDTMEKKMAFVENLNSAMDALEA